MEFLKIGNVKGPLEMDSQSDLMWLLASRAMSTNLAITPYWEVQMMSYLLGVKVDSKSFPAICNMHHETL
jgi:hypothetical protein